MIHITQHLSQICFGKGITPYSKVHYLLLLLALIPQFTACQLIKFIQPKAPSSSATLSKKSKPKASVDTLRIRSARYVLRLDPLATTSKVDGGSSRIEGGYRLETTLILKSSQPGSGSPKTFALELSKSTRTNLEVSGSCTLSSIHKEKKDAGISIFSCVQNDEGEYQLVLEYKASLSQLSGRGVITEGEREYHLVYLPESSASEFLPGFTEKYQFPRQVIIEANRKRRLFGHPLSMSTEFSNEESKLGPLSVSDASPEKSIQTTRLTWSNTESDEAFPLFFGFGNWESPQSFSFQWNLHERGGAQRRIRQSAQLITPLGSRHHRVGTQSLKQLQLKTIKDHGKRLGSLWSDLINENSGSERKLVRESPLLFISLPSHSEYTPPNLKSFGVIFIDESWFYKHSRFGNIMKVTDQLELYNKLYISLQSRLLRTVDQRFLKAISWWRSMTHLWRGLSEALPQGGPYSIYQTQALEHIAAHKNTSINRDKSSYEELFGGVMKMISSWLTHRREKKLDDNILYDEIERSIGQTLTVSQRDQTKPSQQMMLFGYQLNHIDSHLKQIIESYLNHAGLPLVYVKWTQTQRGDSYNIRFTLSQRPFSPNTVKPQLNPSMWVIPICLKLGIKDNPPRAHCLLLDQPERSDYELSLEAPLEWVHPNLDQNGLYLWTLDPHQFEALIKAKQLSLNEFLAIPEMASSLLVTPQGSPTLYLKSVKELALSPEHPLSLDLLFTHLNQIVLYFGNHHEEAGLAELWASSVLQGVMMSKAEFTQSPLNHLTQMQLAQWDQSEVGVGLRLLTKRERAQIKNFLRPTSNQEAFEDDVAQFKLEQIQYPLLIQALSGDQKLWRKLYHKLAESDDQPLARLLIIQAMVQFISPVLFYQTLNLLQPVDNNNGVEDSEKVVENTLDSVNEDDDKGEEGDKSGDDKAQVSLRVEDALELARGIRSTRARQLAWRWIVNQSKKNGEDTHIEQLIIYGNRVDIQSSILGWAGATCDQKALTQLESIFQKGALSFRLSALEKHRDILRRVRRCVQMNKLKSSAETWIKSSFEE